MTDDLVKRAKSVYLSDENGPFIHELARRIESLTAEKKEMVGLLTEIYSEDGYEYIGEFFDAIENTLGKMGQES